MMQDPFDRFASGPFEQDMIPRPGMVMKDAGGLHRAGDRVRLHTGSGGPVADPCGAGAKGDEADAGLGGDPVAEFAVKEFFFRSEFKHPAKHKPKRSFGGGLKKGLDGGSHTDRIGVVGVVDDPAPGEVVPLPAKGKRMVGFDGVNNARPGDTAGPGGGGGKAGVEGKIGAFQGRLGPAGFAGGVFVEVDPARGGIAVEGVVAAPGLEGDGSDRGGGVVA